MKAEIFNYKCWVSTANHNDLCKCVESCLLRSGFSILGHVDHQFIPQGYTCLWLLAESHAAIHTFPEHCRSYIELSSCVESLLLNYESNFTAFIQAESWSLI